MNDGVKLEVGVFVRNVIAKQKNEELLTGVSLRHTDGGGVSVMGW